MEYTLKKDDLEITVDLFGAQLISVKYRGQERLWQNENGSWKEHAPLLFPVCGHVNMTVDKKSYPILSHGFAKREQFSFVSQDENSMSFSLEVNDSTRAVYPYEFLFTVKYVLSGNELKIEYTVENKGDKPMYACLGGHESFALSEALKKHKIVFEKDEVFDSLKHDDGGYLTGKIKKLGKGRELILPEKYLQKGRTVIFKAIQSREVELFTVKGKKLAEIEFEGFSNLLLWHSVGSNMICIEPWHNVPDSSKDDTTEFSQKYGVQKIEKTKTFIRKIRYY